MCGPGNALYTRAMRPRTRLDIVPVIAWLVAGMLLSDPTPAVGQQRDARLPDPGSLWLEISPNFLNWSDQFSLDSPNPNLVDGDREPLHSDFDGLIADRLFPGPLPFIADINADASTLGFDPLDGDDFSMGRLNFGTINAQLRRLAAGFEVGVVDRVAIGIRAPFTFSDVEPHFVFDSLSATVTSAVTAFPVGSTFLGDARSAITDLDVLIAGGTLMGTELVDAIALRADADAFLAALERRVMDGRLVPTGSSPAGMQMVGRFSGFVGAFDGLGLVLPGLPLPSNASGADLARFLAEGPVSGMVPANTSAGLTLGEVELTARYSFLDQITHRGMPSAAPETGDETAEEAVSAIEELRTVRFRTSVGALVRIPVGTNGRTPFQIPSNFVELPIGDGQTDVEFSLYQDVAVGDWLLVRAVGRYGIQLADELTLRVHPPDRPFAFASTETVVSRNLGDYVRLNLRPDFKLNSAIRVGLDYEFWKLGDASFSIAEPLADVPDATPLEIETGQTRHMVGIAVTYDLSEARDREHLIQDRPATHSPWQFTISMRRSVAGSGGQTPAAFRYGAAFRIPMKIF